MHMHPQRLDFPLEAAVFLLGAHHDIEPPGAGLQQILEDVGFAIGQGDDAGARTLRGGGADWCQRTDPFEALFGLDRFAIALGSFAELGRIARPGFDVENAQGQTVRAEGERTVDDQPLGAIDAIADRADALHLGMHGVAKARAVLRHQHQALAAHAVDGGAMMGFEQGVHGDPMVIKKPVGGLDRGRRAAGLGDIGLRFGKERPGKAQQPVLQPAIAELGAAEFAAHPARQRGCRWPAQAFEPHRRQRIKKHPLLRQPACAGAILAAAASGHADLDPIGRAVDRARARRLDIALHQPRGRAVALLPIAGDAARQLSQNVRAQMLDPDRRQDQKPAVANHPRQLGAARGIIPAQPLIAHADAPGRRAHRQPADRAVALADDQVADLRTAQGTGTQRVMRGHHGMPGLARRGSPIDRPQGDHPELTQGPAHFAPNRRRCVIRSTLWRLATRHRQHDLAAPLQRDKPLAAGHLLQPPARVSPRQSLAHLLRQPIARQSRPLADARPNPRKAFRGFKLLMRRRGSHDPHATSSNPPCPEAFTGNNQR
jgi:hypothetical protein